MADGKVAVLDASAVLALILGERGADIVADHLDGAIVSAVNLSEATAKMIERGAPAELVSRELQVAQIRIAPFDAIQAIEAARLRPATSLKGLSLGDRACLALARVEHCPAVTADRAWAEIDVGVEIRLIR